jgi:hypothetical protein
MGFDAGIVGILGRGEVAFVVSTSETELTTPFAK